MNKVVQISLASGLIGLIATNPRRALEQCILRENTAGWTCIYFTGHQDTNILMTLLKALVLVCTLGLWTWGAGYMVLFHRPTSASESTVVFTQKQE